MIPACRADSIGGVRTKRIFSQQREFVARSDFPKPIGGGLGVVAELRLALPQCVLGASALRQVEHESDTLVPAFLEGCHADQHGNAAAVFPEVLLLKRPKSSGQLVLLYQSRVAIAPLRR